MRAFDQRAGIWPVTPFHHLAKHDALASADDVSHRRVRQSIVAVCFGTFRNYPRVAWEKPLLPISSIDQRRARAAVPAMLTALGILYSYVPTSGSTAEAGATRR